MVSQARSQCKTMLVNKALVLSVRRHHARVTHQIMLLVLSSAGALGAKGSNERLSIVSKCKMHVLGLQSHCFCLLNQLLCANIVVVVVVLA